MLTESDVIAAVCEYLEADGYKIKQRLTESQKGDDIVALRGDETLLVEAKGETSSKKGTARYGETFNSSQVLDHVAKAFYRAAKMRADNVRVGIALPRNKAHMARVAAIQDSLAVLGITTFWVCEDGGVIEDKSHHLT